MDDFLEIERCDSAVEIPLNGNNKETPSLPTLEKPSTNPTDPAAAREPTSANQHQTPSRLLSLPPELQLLIWEFAVIEPEPLYLNCPCDSSYGGWTDEYYEDQARWDSGEKQPPWQPALTRVCRSIRADALPMFYKHNQFQAGYCYETDTDIVTDWLKVIGEHNRRLMKGFYFYDANNRHDANCPKDLKRLTRSELVKGMGGVLESKYGEEYCKHGVLFVVKGQDEELEGLESLFGGDV